MKIRTFVPALLLVCVLLGACQSQPKQMPSGIWEGAQEAGDVDWSMSVNFDRECKPGFNCAKVNYITCSGELSYSKSQFGSLVFTENIHQADECLSGSKVKIKYNGQDQPMLVTWTAPDGSEGPTAELHYQDPNAAPAPIEGFGQQVAFIRDLGAVNFGFTVDPARNSLWVPQGNLGKVSRIDASSFQVVAEINIGSPISASYGVDPNFVAVSGDQIWVTQRASRAVGRIDPSTNKVVEAIPLEAEPYAIAIDGNTLWITVFNESFVLKVDTQTNEVIRIKDIQYPLGITVGGGSVWTAEHREGGKLIRIDPQTASISERIPLPQGSSSENLVYFEDSVWVANNFGKTVSRFSPSTNEMITIEFPERAAHISAGGGFLWVAMFPPQSAEVDLSKYSIAKVDPATNEIVITIPFPGAVSTAYMNGILWVDNRNDMSGDKLHAIQLTE